MAKRFTSLLVQDGILSQSAMQEAQERQSLYGGRLGTNLLEMGLLNEQVLTQYLSRAAILPAASMHLTDLDPDALRLLDIDTVERLRILPVRLHRNGYADVLVEDPLSARLIAELRELTGFTFSPFIVPEFRFVQLLHEMFGRRLSERYARLIQKFPQELRLGVGSGLRGLEPPPSEPEREAAPAVALEKPTASHSASDYRRNRQLGFGWAQTDVIVFLRDLYCRDTTLELLLGYTGNFALRRVLLVVARDRLAGFGGAGLGCSDEVVRGVRLDVTSGSLLAELREGKTYFKGHPVEIGMERLYSQLKIAAPPHCVLLPITVGPRAGLILVLDDERRKIDVDSLAPLFITIDEVSTTLERIIMLSKRNELPPEELRVPPIPMRYRHHQNVGKPRPSPEPSAVVSAPQARIIRVPEPSEMSVASRGFDGGQAEPGLASSSDMLRASFGRRTAKALAERRGEAEEAPEAPARALAVVEVRPARVEGESAEALADTAPRGRVEEAAEPDAPAVEAAPVTEAAPDALDGLFAEAFRATDSFDGLASLDMAWDLPTAFEPTTEVPSGAALQQALEADVRAVSSSETVESRVRTLRAGREAFTTEQRPASWQLEETANAVRAEVHNEALRQPLRADTTELRRVGEIRNLLSLLDFDAFRTHERLVFKNVVSLVDNLHRALEGRDLGTANTLADSLLVELHRAGIALPPELAERLIRSGLLETAPRPSPPRQTGNLHRVSRDAMASVGSAAAAVEGDEPELETMRMGAIDRATGEVKAPSAGPYARSAEAARQYVAASPDLARPAVTMSRPIEINPGYRGAGDSSDATPTLAPSEALSPVDIDIDIDIDADVTGDLPIAVAPTIEASVPGLTSPNDEAPEPPSSSPRLDVLAIDLVAVGEEEGEEEAEEAETFGEEAHPSAPMVALELEPIEAVPAPSAAPIDPETLSALTYYRPLVAAFCDEGDEGSREALLQSGGRALPAILERFPGPLTVDRYSASMATLPRCEHHGPLLEVLCELGDLAAPALVAMLEVPSADLRFYATCFFASVYYEPALPELGDRLFDRDGQIRELARSMLRRYRPGASFPRLLELLRGELASADPWHVEQAALALTAFTDTAAIPALIALLDQGSRRVTEAAHRALCALCLVDEGMSARKWEKWYERHGRESRNVWLVEALNHPEATIRELAAAELAAIPGLLVNYSPQASRSVRQQAQQVVAQHFKVG